MMEDDEGQNVNDQDDDYCDSYVGDDDSYSVCFDDKVIVDEDDDDDNHDNDV